MAEEAAAATAMELFGDIGFDAAAAEMTGATAASAAGATAVGADALSYGPESTGIADFGNIGFDATLGSDAATGLGAAASSMYDLEGSALSTGLQYGNQGMDWGNLANNALKYGAPAMSIMSGIYGMDQAAAMRKASQQMLQGGQNLWQTSGGQGQAIGQLQQFMQNPAAAAAQDPAFALRQESAKRAMAQYGSNSGAVATGAANASTDWYNQRLAQMANLAGAPGNSTGTASVGMQGLQGANSLASSSLGSVGFGAMQGAYPNLGQYTPQQLQMLLLQAQNPSTKMTGP